MGSYAQIVREISSGASLGDQIGYGPLWYLIGVWVFEIAGVNYGALLIAFNLMVIASALTMTQALQRATDRIWLGVIIALLIIIVPPLQASTMRLVSLAVFAWPLFAVARTNPRDDIIAYLGAAGAIGFNVLLRPDFAYLYGFILWTLLLYKAICAIRTLKNSINYIISRTLIILNIVVIVVSPIAMHAIVGGYFDNFVADIFSFPRRFLIILNLFSEDSGSGNVPATFLSMPSIAGIFEPDLGRQIFVFLIYSTLVTLVLAAFMLVSRTIRQFRDYQGNGTLLAALLLAASQWPAFGLFRPDWVHFVSFAHGYLILAAVLWAGHVSDQSRPAAQGIEWKVRLLLICQLIPFAGYGATAGDTSLLSKRAGRTELFEGHNGVKVFVNSTENALFSNINRIIERNSQPGDYIVCVPYCAGFSFMSDRKPLFKRHYVDDSTLNFDKNWIDDAIALTAREKPAVIIVLDWAPNGSEASRFSVWANRYIDAITKDYPISARFDLGMIYVRNSASRGSPEIIPVADYGPKKARLGEPFNQQSNGTSALWMKFEGFPRSGAVLRLNGNSLETAVKDNIATALVPAELLSEPGNKQLQMINPLMNLESRPVTIELSDR